MTNPEPQARRARRSREVTAVGQMPLWGDRVRGIPNSLARSAFFTARAANEPREFYRSLTEVVALTGYSILRKGEELRQDDCDVLMQLIHLAREQPLEQGIQFTAYSFLKELGWGSDGGSYERLRTCIDRLQGNSIRVSTHDVGGFQGQMVRKFAWKGEDDQPLQRWVAWLEPEIVRLFGDNAYTTIWWAQRTSLSSPLAKFLHAYLATHETPFPVRCETLHGLCGSRAKRMADFRRSLKLALDSLVGAKFLDSWEIDAGDLVRVIRSPKEKFLEHRKAAIQAA